MSVTNGIKPGFAYLLLLVPLVVAGLVIGILNSVSETSADLSIDFAGTTNSIFGPAGDAPTE